MLSKFTIRLNEDREWLPRSVGAVLIETEDVLSDEGDELRHLLAEVSARSPSSSSFSWMMA
jgi:hypothetical protein